MKVALLTTVGEHCGIAVYSHELGGPLGRMVDLQVEEIEPGCHPIDYYQAQAARLNTADLVHIQHEYGFWGGILSRSGDFQKLVAAIHKPIVVTAHTTTPLRGMLRLDSERRPLQRLVKTLLVSSPGYRRSIERFPFEAGRYCIVHTSQGRDQLIERGIDPARVRLIEAGFPVPRPAPTGGAVIRQRFGFENRRIITLFGYITSTKGYELVMSALQELPSDVAFVIAGGARIPEEEPYVEELKAKIAGEGLQERVGITGHLSEDEIAEVMAATEVVLTPHTLATGSYTVRVALAYGKPVVASDQACFQDIQRDASCIRLFRTGDAAHFAACLKGVLGNEAGRREMTERALAFARSRSWEEVARQNHRVYCEALSVA